MVKKLVKKVTTYEYKFEKLHRKLAYRTAKKLSNFAVFAAKTGATHSQHSRSD